MIVESPQMICIHLLRGETFNPFRSIWLILAYFFLFSIFPYNNTLVKLPNFKMQNARAQIWIFCVKHSSMLYSRHLSPNELTIWNNQLFCCLRSWTSLYPSTCHCMHLSVKMCSGKHATRRFVSLTEPGRYTSNLYNLFIVSKIEMIKITASRFSHALISWGNCLVESFRRTCMKISIFFSKMSIIKLMWFTD